MVYWIYWSSVEWFTGFIDILWPVGLFCGTRRLFSWLGVWLRISIGLDRSCDILFSMLPFCCCHISNLPFDLSSVSILFPFCCHHSPCLYRFFILPINCNRHYHDSILWPVSRLTLSQAWPPSRFHHDNTIPPLQWQDERRMITGLKHIHFQGSGRMKA